jgi:hypothetical protein
MRKQIRPRLWNLRQELHDVARQPKSPLPRKKRRHSAPRTLTTRLRAALELRNAKSIAAWSISDRFVQSGRRTSRAVSSCEGPCGASAGVSFGDVSFGLDGTGVAALQKWNSEAQSYFGREQAHAPVVLVLVRLRRVSVR